MAAKASTEHAPSLRPGATRVALANEGRHVFLYDDAAAPELAAAGVMDVLVSGEVARSDPRRRALEQDRRIAIYELAQDDDVIVDVAVGSALGARERKAAAWHKPQKTVLHLPSGRLRIETLNSSRLATAPPGEDGRTLDVPPGEYVLALNRVNWDELGSCRAGRPDLPTEFVTLTPLAGTKAPAKTPTMLGWDEIAGAQGAWERDWRIVDGVFHGRVFPGAALLDRQAACIVNLTPTAVARLGLRWGACLRLETAQWRTEAIFLARTTRFAAEHVLGEAACAAWSQRVAFHTEPALARTPGSLLLGFVADAGAPELRIAPQGEAVRVLVLPEPVMPPLDLPLLQDRHVDAAKREIHGRVVSRTERCLVLNVDEATLAQAGYDLARGDRLQLVIGDDERTAVRGGTSTPVDACAEAWYARIPAAADLLAEVAASDAAEFGEHLELARSGRYCGSLKLNRAEPARTRYRQIWDLEIPPGLRATLPLCWRLSPHLEQPIDLVTFTALGDEVIQTRELRNPIHVAARAGDAVVLRVVDAS